MSRYTVYADISCPFSYALHEQLSLLGLLDQVDWRLIEHIPDSAVYNTTAESQAELASDVFVVRTRAPKVELALPKKRSDSRFASLCVIQATEIDPHKAIALRHLLYRALWVDGRDIADVSVIFDCLTAAELPAEVNIEDRHEALLNHWQDSWMEGEFRLRIPVLLAEDGRSTVGLPSPEGLIAFFQGEEVTSTLQPDEKEQRIEKQTVMIYSDYGIEPIWSVIQNLRMDYNILLPANLKELRTQLQEDPPDLLLLSTEQQWAEMLRLCAEITSHQEDVPFPVACIGQEQNDRVELEAYQAGAADFLLLSRATSILEARIQILMQLKQSKDQLARSARIDGLTQVNNRREFERSIETEWRRAHRAKRTLSLIMIDIDHFKAFNDFYGHLAGDGCLRTVAKAIKNSIHRAQDMVCRYGGEEFAVILPDTDLQGARVLAEKIKDAVTALRIKHEKSEATDHISISAGVAAHSPFRGGSPHDLISNADQALYQAKEDGRNRINTSPASE